MGQLSRPKKIGLAVASSALVIGAGAGIVGATGVAFAEPTPGAPTPSATGSAAPSEGPAAPGGPGDRGPRGGGPAGVAGASASALADKLGLTETQVAEAVRAVRDDQRSADKDTDATPEQREQAFVAALAEKLGVDADRLTTALEELRSEHRAEEQAALKTRLDEAVADGTLTQAEADAVLKAADAGVIGYGPHGPR